MLYSDLERFGVYLKQAFFFTKLHLEGEEKSYFSLKQLLIMTDMCHNFKTQGIARNPRLQGKDHSVSLLWGSSLFIILVFVG